MLQNVGGALKVNPFAWYEKNASQNAVCRIRLPYVYYHDLSVMTLDSLNALNAFIERFKAFCGSINAQGLIRHTDSVDLHQTAPSGEQCSSLGKVTGSWS